jgi:glycosyltransferase involved in cell wall biosynthesis
MLTERIKIRLNRFGRRLLAAPRLHSVRPLPPKRTPGEIWLFMACRDEALRLPAMLDYHFKLGVSRVVLVDNGSTDATPDIAAANSRVHLFKTAQTFMGNEIAWKEILLRRYGIGHWNLVLDADELFAYHGMDSLSLPELARSLERENAEALPSVFIEMFSKAPPSALRYRPGDDLIGTAPYFDASPYVRVPYRSVFGMPGTEFVYMGGTRTRVFGGEFGCSKVPFFKYHPKQFLRLGLHTLEGARFPSRQAAVLHFKYLQDFHEKVLREVRRNVHWNHASEYRTYAALLEKNPDFTLWHPGAVHYDSWRSLADAGLIF